MKRILPLLAALLLIITSCFNATEEIKVQEDGSGVYAMKMDMSGMFDFMKGMQGEEADAASGAMKQADMDTTIRFASFTDTSSKLTAEEKALMKDATMHMTMNEEKKEFLIDLKYPYKRLEDVQRIMEISQRTGGMMGKAFGKEGETNDGEQPDFNTFYTLNFRNGLLEKTLDSTKFKQMEEAPQYGQMKESMAMMGDASMNTVISLPRKVKKAEGAGIKVSEDGKTVTIAASFADIFENPKALTFRVEY